MANAKETVQKHIDGNPAVIFSKSYCPFCQQTKSALNKLGAAYEAIELDKISEGSALQDALQEISGQRTVPNIYISQKHIGGNSDLQGLLQSGDLEGLLKDAGAVKA